MPSLILISDATNRQAYPLPKASFTLGRDPASQLCLPSTSVSRSHATILFDQNGNFILRDEGSTNGTYLNNERIVRHVLKDKDVIRIGDYLFQIDLSEKRKLPVASKPRLVIPADGKMDEGGVTQVLPQPGDRGAKGRRRMLWFAGGGGLVLIWVVVTLVLFQIAARKKNGEQASGKAPQVVAAKVPQIVSPMLLLGGKWTWAPNPEAWDVLSSLLVKVDALTLGSGDPEGDKQKAVDAFHEAWQQGVVVYEPVFQRAEMDEQHPDRLHLVLEDAFTKVTFWDYNSTVVPEKQPVVGMFYAPTLTNTLYYVRNPKLTAKIPKFNGEEFPWRMGEHGVEWSVVGLRVNVKRDLGRFRWFVILKPHPVPMRFSIHTLEGDLFRNIPKDYPMNVYPAEVLAEVLYLDSDKAPLQIRVNASLPWDDDPQAIVNLLTLHFKDILAHKPRDPTEIPHVFRLESADSSKTAK